MFYDKFEALCKERGVSVTKAIIDMGLSRSLGTKWKKTGAMPNGKTLAMISDHFDVPIDYFTSSAFDKAMRSIPGYEEPMDAVTAQSVDDIVKFALFGDKDIDDDVYEEVKRFAAFAASKKKEANQ